ncbi:SEC-C metal-binding domain-containing protein [Hydrogenimonas sp. SS33]|uniref:SEC-C metal-binding domain-containing protein n=1 Tax=Hydrogenimonas leucolamina TaxID=2954236 RepID=UPI00336C035A
MTSFVAFCENPKCGAVFEVPILVGGPGNATIHMTNTRAGPCPVCGSFGLIPDGVYQYANHAVSLLTGPETSVRVLRQVYEILKRAKSTSEDKQAVLKEVEEVSPQAAQTLQQAPEISNYLQWITVLIALVSLAIQVHTSYFKGDDVERQFRDHLLEENKELRKQRKKSTPYKRENPKIRRNDPCPCGSGKKYKKCCGLTQV